MELLTSCMTARLALTRERLPSVVGPNGAGKSTAMKALFWHDESSPRQCSAFNGENITSLSPQARVLKGMSFVPQTHNVFSSMTVEENLEMGAFSSSR